MIVNVREHQNCQSPNAQGKGESCNPIFDIQFGNEKFSFALPSLTPNPPAVQLNRNVINKLQPALGYDFYPDQEDPHKNARDYSGMH